jgi:hypothetical protein
VAQQRAIDRRHRRGHDQGHYYADRDQGVKQALLSVGQMAGDVCLHGGNLRLQRRRAGTYRQRQGPGFGDIVLQAMRQFGVTARDRGELRRSDLVEPVLVGCLGRGQLAWHPGIGPDQGRDAGLLPGDLGGVPPEHGQIGRLLERHVIPQRGLLIGVVG